MSGIVEYTQHPHAEDRKATGPPTVAAARMKLHGPGPLSRLNARIGLKIIVIVGTMWCAYLFTLLALVSARSRRSSPPSGRLARRRRDGELEARSGDLASIVARREGPSCRLG